MLRLQYQEHGHEQTEGIESDSCHTKQDKDSNNRSRVLPPPFLIRIGCGERDNEQIFWNDFCCLEEFGYGIEVP